DQKKHNLWILYKNHKISAVVVESVAPDGYSGSIHLLVAAYLNGKIIGVRVLSHQETPGIGDKIELSVSDWIKQFSNILVLNDQDKHVLLKKFG
ncbi:FMN-binding protein, partial [Buchnera aphidicola]|nr:FMN-binding protein [Buchnera aphidicola]